MASSGHRRNLDITYVVELFTGLGIDDRRYVIIVDDMLFLGGCFYLCHRRVDFTSYVLLTSSIASLYKHC